MQRNINIRLIVKMQIRGRQAVDENGGSGGEGGRASGLREPAVPQPGRQESNATKTGYECVKEQEAAVEGEGEEDGRPREGVLGERGRTTIR